MRLGGVDTIKVDVRIIAATNVDLQELTRKDGSARTCSTASTSSSCSCRRCASARRTSRCSCSTSSRSTPRRAARAALVLTPAALDRLMAYDWPGNVRELENVIERAVVLCSDREIGADLIPDHVSANPLVGVPEVVIPAEGIHFREVIIGHERQYIEAALEAAGGVQKKAAELLHIKPTTLNEMIKRYDIRPRRKKGSGEDEDADGELGT